MEYTFLNPIVAFSTDYSTVVKHCFSQIHDEKFKQEQQQIFEEAKLFPLVANSVHLHFI